MQKPDSRLGVGSARQPSNSSPSPDERQAAILQEIERSQKSARVQTLAAVVLLVIAVLTGGAVIARDRLFGDAQPSPAQLAAVTAEASAVRSVPATTTPAPQPALTVEPVAPAPTPRATPEPKPAPVAPAAPWETRVLTKTANLMAYRRLDDTCEIGFFDRVDGASCYFQPPGGEIVRIGRHELVEGTAMVGSPRDILRQNQDLDFLDYAALMIARSMDENASSSNSYVAVRSRLDVESMVQEYQEMKYIHLQRVGVKREQTTQYSSDELYERYKRSVTEQSREYGGPRVVYPAYYSRGVRPRGLRIVGYGLLGAPFHNWRWLESNSRYRKELVETEQRIRKERLEKKLTEEDPGQAFLVELGKHIQFLREQERELEQLKRSVEDRLIAKLVKLGVPVVERQMLDEVVEERTRYAGGEFEERSALGRKLKHATHVVTLEIGRSGSADYRAAVRLVDAGSGLNLWADAVDRAYQPEGSGDHRYMVASGVTVALDSLTRSLSGKTAGSAASDEAPMHLDVDGVLSGVSGGKSGGLFVMEARLGGRHQVRDLFQEVSIGVSQLPEPRIISSFGDVPDGQALRFLVHRLAEECMPKAGRLIRVEGGTALADFDGASQLLSPGDDVAVVRVEELSALDEYGLSMGDQREAILRRLPLRYAVIDSRRDRVMFPVGETSVQILWADSIDLRPGDLIVPEGQRMPVLAMNEVTYQEPTFEDAKALGMYSSQVTARKIVDKTRDIGPELADKLSRALVDVVGLDLLPRDADRASDLPSHEISIEIQPTTPVGHRKGKKARPGTYNIRVTMNSAADGGREVFNQEFKYRGLLIEKWMP